MGKFENDYQLNKIEEWKDKYMNYIFLKQKINQYMAALKINNINEISPIEKNEIISKYIKEFTGELDKESRKVYIFFSKNEKQLYKDINKYLHIKDDFSNFNLDDYLSQYSELKDLSLISLKMSKYVYYNLKCLIKILTKFDKKIIDSKDKDDQIKNSYIISKLEDQNSDILYLINFKMIDEVNVIVEDLIKCLKDNFKLNKNKFKDSVVELSDNDSNKSENLLDKKTLNLNEASNIIDYLHKEIKDNLKNIDKMSNKIIMLFMPWKQFLRISGDISSKLIQITKELNNFNDTDSVNNVFRNNKSLVDTISSSKQNYYNIYIILFHGFIYMFSFSCILPSYPELIYSDKFWDNSKDIRRDNYFYYSLFCSLLMIMVPLGSISSHIIENALFKKSTKIPIILSTIGLFLGNILYYISIKVEPFILLFIGRLFIGIFNLRAHNKMYLINFLLRKDVSFYLTMFHTFSMLGLSFGFLSNIGITYMSDDNIIFNKYTFGCLLSIILSIILFLISLKFFTEARSSDFNMTSMKSFTSNDSLERNSFLPRDSSLNINSNNNSQPPPQIEPINSRGDIYSNINIIDEDIMNEEFTEDVRRKSIMVNDINDQLGDFNRKSNFNDTNLVSLSISQLTFQEKEGLKYLFKSYIVYLFIVFTTKFINETIIVNIPLFIQKYNLEKENEKSNKKIEQFVVPLVLGSSCLIVLIIEFFLKKKNKIISEKRLLIILFILNLIANILLVFLTKKYSILYFINIGFSLIFINIIEKYATHFFNYIIPQNYIVCKIQGNTFINIISTLSRIIASALIFFAHYEHYEIVIFILNIIFSLICTVLYFVFYSDIRIKSISRIITKQEKDEVKIATEI